MLTQFRIDLKIHRSTFWVTMAGLLGTFLVGILMVVLIMTLDSDPDSWFCMGTMLAAVALFCVCLFAGGFAYPQEFMLALSMGRTRKAFMGAYFLRLILVEVTGYAIVLVLHQIELAAYAHFFPQYENDFYFAFLTDWRILLPIMTALPILSMFFGTLFGRYGKKGLIVFYLLWIFCCLVLPRLADAEPGNSGLLNQAALFTLQTFRAIPVPVWIAFGTVLLVGMSLTTILFGRKQMVR